jgi:maleate isomerase
MTREYGSLFRLGLVVPPANSTVEPELAAFVPRGAAIYATRLPGTVEHETGKGLDERIKGYIASLPDATRSFGGMALDSICLMHTGVSYVVGVDGESGLREQLALSGADHAFVAAAAVAETLAALECRRVALVLPYPDWLCEAAVSYWEARGLDVVDVARPPDVVSIYEITPNEVIAAIRRLDAAAAEAVVITGTGMATFRAIETYAPASEIPVISSNQCVAWQAVNRRVAKGAELPDLSPPLRYLCDKLNRISRRA